MIYGLIFNYHTEYVRIPKALSLMKTMLKLRQREPKNYHLFLGANANLSVGSEIPFRKEPLILKYAHIFLRMESLPFKITLSSILR